MQLLTGGAPLPAVPAGAVDAASLHNGSSDEPASSTATTVHPPKKVYTKEQLLTLGKLPGMRARPKNFVMIER